MNDISLLVRFAESSEDPGKFTTIRNEITQARVCLSTMLYEAALRMVAGDVEKAQALRSSAEQWHETLKLQREFFPYEEFWCDVEGCLSFRSHPFEIRISGGPDGMDRSDLVLPEPHRVMAERNFECVTAKLHKLAKIIEAAGGRMRIAKT